LKSQPDLITNCKPKAFVIVHMANYLFPANVRGSGDRHIVIFCSIGKDQKLEIVDQSQMVRNVKLKRVVRIKRQINDLMEKGYIRPNKSPYGAPLVVGG